METLAPYPECTSCVNFSSTEKSTYCAKMVWVCKDDVLTYYNDEIRPRVCYEKGKIRIPISGIEINRLLSEMHSRAIGIAGWDDARDYVKICLALSELQVRRAMDRARPPTTEGGDKTKKKGKKTTGSTPATDSDVPVCRIIPFPGRDPEEDD